VSTPSHTQLLRFAPSPRPSLPTLMVCPISSEYAHSLAIKTYSSHHSYRAGNHINPQLCLKIWEYPETCDPHLFGRGGPQRHHGATRTHRKKPQSFRREGGKDKRLCGGGCHDPSDLEDAGRESCVEVCRSSWVSDDVGSRCPQLTMRLWSMPFVTVLSLKSEVFIFTAFA
jgi:hypothetical protein